VNHEVRFVVVGLSHNTAPLAVREQAYIPLSGVGECLRRLADRELIESGVLLSTCNRTEIYAVSSADDAKDRLRASFGSWPHELAFESWDRYAYALDDDDAMAHLFRVAAGLDSMVLGEGQVLGQLKDALRSARTLGPIDARLQIILQGALRAGKRVRHETELGRRPVSVGHAAVTKAADVLGDLAGRDVLLVGAGTMSQVALRLLRNQRIGHVYLTSRTREHAGRVAGPLGGQVVELDHLEEVIAGVDIVICSSGAPHHLFDQAAVERWQTRRAMRPLLLIDLAVPRDVDPAVSAIPGVQLVNIDDLRDVATGNLEARQASIPAAERIVEEELDRTRHALQAREAAPTASALVQKVERLRDRELDRHLPRVPDPQTQRVMVELAEALTAKFLDGPLRSLRESPDPVVETAVFRDAFDLDPDEPRDR
jgi:glutamyl-tRNA reductase